MNERFTCAVLTSCPFTRTGAYNIIMIYYIPQRLAVNTRETTIIIIFYSNNYDINRQQ